MLVTCSWATAFWWQNDQSDTIVTMTSSQMCHKHTLKLSHYNLLPSCWCSYFEISRPKDEPPCCKLGSCGIINRFCFNSNGTSALYTANNVEMIKDFFEFEMAYANRKRNTLSFGGLVTLHFPAWFLETRLMVPRFGFCFQRWAIKNLALIFVPCRI